jgi:hypothetical protein
MTYFLLYKYDRKEEQKVAKLPFPSEEEAVVRACGIFVEGGGWDFEVQDENGAVITTDTEIRERCEQPKTP